MIEAHYGFRVAPFRLMPDPRFFFASGTHSRALAFLEYGLQQGEGHVVLTGDVGVGKSMVLAYLLQRIDSGRMQVVCLSTSNLAPIEALRRIASLLGVAAPGADKGGLLDAIELYLSELAHDRRRAVILVDEAQCLPASTLDELRMLANLEIDGHFPLQCFFVGQSEFRDTLRQPELAPLRQRVVAAHHVEPLGLDELAGYVEHRLQVAGWEGRPDLDPNLFSRLHQASGGVPRVINALLGRLLMFGALERRNRLDSESLAAVLVDLDQESTGARCTGLHASAALDPARSETERLDALEARVAELEEALLEVIDATSRILPPHDGAPPPVASTNGTGVSR